MEKERSFKNANLIRQDRQTIGRLTGLKGTRVVALRRKSIIRHFDQLNMQFARRKPKGVLEVFAAVTAYQKACAGRLYLMKRKESLRSKAK